MAGALAIGAVGALGLALVAVAHHELAFAAWLGPRALDWGWWDSSLAPNWDLAVSLAPALALLAVVVTRAWAERRRRGPGAVTARVPGIWPELAAFAALGGALAVPWWHLLRDRAEAQRRYAWQFHPGDMYLGGIAGAEWHRLRAAVVWSALGLAALVGVTMLGAAARRRIRDRLALSGASEARGVERATARRFARWAPLAWVVGALAPFTVAALVLLGPQLPPQAVASDAWDAARAERLALGLRALPIASAWLGVATVALLGWLGARALAHGQRRARAALALGLGVAAGCGAAAIPVAGYALALRREAATPLAAVAWVGGECEPDALGPGGGPDDLVDAPQLMVYRSYSLLDGVPTTTGAALTDALRRKREPADERSPRAPRADAVLVRVDDDEDVRFVAGALASVRAAGYGEVRWVVTEAWPAERPILGALCGARERAVRARLGCTAQETPVVPRDFARTGALRRALLAARTLGPACLDLPPPSTDGAPPTLP